MTTSMQPDSQALVSVVVPAYNAAATIDETLRSVRAQTHRNLDIIVVDDGSRDTTIDIVRRHARVDPRIRLVSQENGGVARARNRGVAEARGDLIAPVDADDLWAPTKVEKQVATIEAGGPSMGLVYTWYALIDENSVVIDWLSHASYEGVVLEEICIGNFVGSGSSPLMRKEAVLASSGYESSLRDRKAQGCEDLLLYFRIAESYKFGVVTEYLTGYRQLAGAMSSDVLQMMRSQRIVTAEMRRKYPKLERQTYVSEAFLAKWLLWRMLNARRLQPVFRLLLYVMITNPLVSIEVLTPILVKALRQRLKREPSARAPSQNFVIGSLGDA